MARIATRIELAFGADLTADPATWTWTDVSAYALGSVSINFGRADEASTTQPATCRIRLRNTDGRFTPRFPTSPYYPNVRRQTPVRVALNPGGTGYVQRFVGYIDQFTPTWPSGRATYAEVSVTASGSLRRLGQGTTPLKSPLRRVLETSGAFAYWPLEEGPAANNVVSVSGAAATSLVRLLATGPAEFGAVKPVTGAVSMPNFIRGGALDLQVGSSVSSSWTVEFAYFFGTGEPAPDDYGTPNAMNILKLYATNGDYWLFQLSPHNAFFTGGRIALFRSDEPESFFDTLVDTELGGYNPWDGQTHHVAITASQTGGNIFWQLILDGAVYLSGTLAGRTLQAIDLARLNQNGFLASSSVYGLGHFAAFNSVITPTSHASAALGYTGETAGDRITRLCTEEGVPVSVSSTTGTAKMGPQAVASFLSLLRDCEAADGGILYDGESAGITYLARQDRYNLPVALALDGTRSHVKLPFLPIEDDQRVRNDWTVSRPDGASSQYTDAAHIAANGRYDSSATVNVQFDSDLLDQAAWRVHLGTVEEMRVPGLSLQLIDHPELWASWLATTLGERVTVSTLFAQYPPGTLDSIVEGYTEEWDQTSWRVEPNLSPFAPWRVIALANDVGDTGAFIGHLDTDDSALTAGITSTATSIAVKTNSGPVWTTTSDDLPFDINIGGEQIRATAIASAVTDTWTRTVSPGWGTATSGQVWSSSNAVFSATGSAGRATHASGGVVQNVLGGTTGFTAVTAQAKISIGQKLTGAGAMFPSLLLRYVDSSNFYQFGVYYQASGTPTGPVGVVIGKTVAGSGSSLFTNFSFDVYDGSEAFWLTAAVDGSALRIKVWRTTDPEPAGWTATVTDPDLTAGSIGAYSARDVGVTNVNPFVVFDDLTVTDPQTFTVVRSVNGVVKAHLANAPVSLWAPLVLGL